MSCCIHRPDFIPQNFAIILKQVLIFVRRCVIIARLTRTLRDAIVTPLSAQTNVNKAMWLCDAILHVKSVAVIYELPLCVFKDLKRCLSDTFHVCIHSFGVQWRCVCVSQERRAGIWYWYNLKMLQKFHLKKVFIA